MKKTVRNKFQVTHVQPGGTPEVPSEQVTLEARYDDSNPEDTSFSRWTPQGKMEFTCNNPEVMGHFKAGDEVYIDLTKIEKPEPAVATNAGSGE